MNGPQGIDIVALSWCIPEIRESLARAAAELEQHLNAEAANGRLLLRQFGCGECHTIPGVPTAGKSGTAQLGGDAAPHSWFIGYAPADAPTIAVAVIVEGGGAGAQKAVPMGGDVMSYFLGALGAD